MTALEFAHVKASVEALFPEFAERAEESEKARRMPADLAHRLKDMGWFRSGIPKRAGGAEASQRDRAQVLERAAQHDGSAAWTLMIGSEGPTLLGSLPKAVYEKMYRDLPDLVLAGGVAPTGKAERVDGGFRVTGRWPWASGCLHADYLIGGCVVWKNGEPEQGLIPGMPLTHAIVVPVAQAKLHHDDTWFVSGMSGTGSCDFTLDNVFVPGEMSYDNWDWRPNGPEATLLPLFTVSGLNMAIVAIGIAQGAVDDAIALAKAGKKRSAATVRSAEAESRVHAARSLIYDQIDTLTARAAEIPHGFMSLLHPLTKATAARGAFAVKLAAEATHICSEVAGGSAVPNGSPLQRRRRDIDVLRSHIGLSDTLVTRYGAGLLGIETPP